MLARSVCSDSFELRRQLLDLRAGPAAFDHGELGYLGAAPDLGADLVGEGDVGVVVGPALGRGGDLGGLGDDESPSPVVSPAASAVSAAAPCSAAVSSAPCCSAG